MKFQTAALAIALCTSTIALPPAFARNTPHENSPAALQKSSAQMAQSAHADIVNAAGQKIGTATFCKRLQAPCVLMWTSRSFRRERTASTFMR